MDLCDALGSEKKMWRGIWLDCVTLLFRHWIQPVVVECVDAVAMSVNVLIPGKNWTCAKLANCLGEREWFSCVNPSLVQTEVWRVSKLSRCGELEVHVSGEVVCLCRNNVEVVNDVGSGGRL